MTSAPAIGFEYRPSGRMRWIVLGVALLAGVSLVVSGLPAGGKLAVAAIVLALLGWEVRRRPAPPASVGWGPAAGWSLRLADGSDLPAELVSHRVLGGCIVLNLQAAGRRYVLWLLPDNSDADTRRRLRMRLALLHGVAPVDGH